jgi:hypothetical protein
MISGTEVLSDFISGICFAKDKDCYNES